MTTALGEVLATTSLIGFGSNASGISLIGGAIDLTGLSSYAFSMPRAGTITDIAAYFSVAATVTLALSTVTITAQLYSSPTPDDTFTPIPGALVTLVPSLTGVITVGTITSGITTGLAIPVTAETRLLLVLSAAITAGVDVLAVLTGFVSGGINLT